MAGRNQHDEGTEREAFFTRIVHEHTRLMYRVAYSVLRNAEDAEDAVGDALLKLLRGDAWREVANERAFLARAVWRTALDRRQKRLLAVSEDEVVLAVADRRPSPEALFAAGDERRLLQVWMDRLPKDLREPLVLSALEEMNSREIGEVMGLPEGTVRTRLMRARAALREQYEELGRRTRGREVAVTGE